MEPFPTLYHFVHPEWFEQLGGFQRQANVKMFVDWCKLAFREYGKKARFWATMNEANIQSMGGFVIGLHPPGRILDFKGCGLNVLHLMQSHAAAYRAIKCLPGGQDVEVGLVHNVFWLEPKSDSLLYTHIKLLCGVGNYVQGTPQIMEFLRTGRFFWKVPLGANIEYQDPLGAPGLDFIGLNNYTRGVLDWKFTSTTKAPGEVMADFDWPIYPPSLYTSIACVGQLGVPIYITENGCPDHLDDDRRPMWINGYLSQVVRALQDGYDVRGFLYWTLMDNFEWNFAWTPKFGLYAWDRSTPRDRVLREGSKALISWYKRLPDMVAGIRKQQRAAGLRPQQPIVTYTWNGILTMHEQPSAAAEEGVPQQQLLQLESKQV